MEQAIKQAHKAKVIKMTNSTNEMFYRLNADGKAVILWAETGEVVTSIDAGVYPVGSSVSARY